MDSPRANSVETTAVVLRLTPYQESSLIAATISPMHGRLDFLVRGARRIEKRRQPLVDLFRELRVEFRPRDNGELHVPRGIELSREFDGVAAKSANYAEACAIAAFLTRNSRPGLASPECYAALLAALGELASTAPAAGMFPIRRGQLVKLVYLREHGLCPEDAEGESGSGDSITGRLAAYAAGLAPPPRVSQEYGGRLALWIEQMCRYHDL